MMEKSATQIYSLLLFFLKTEKEKNNEAERNHAYGGRATKEAKENCNILCKVKSGGTGFLPLHL